MVIDEDLGALWSLLPALGGGSEGGVLEKLLLLFQTLYKPLTTNESGVTGRFTRNGGEGEGGKMGHLLAVSVIVDSISN